MSSKRQARISEEIKKVVSKLITKELKDPGISSLTSITEVEVTGDLRYAKIYISVLGNDKDRDSTIKALERASGFIRKEIGNRIKLRYTPEPVFYSDNSIENGIYISKLIDKVQKEREEDDE
ncbi:MAG: 30S ribosome-binding factor RbfA [Firmicutes bacterium]|nr:30S ribosome-binding factor RbfA [Bacillota bacterium]